MNNCIECNHRFTFSDKLKSAIRLKNYLKCPKCNSVYKPEITFCRWIYYFLVILISLRISTNIKLNNFLVKGILCFLIVTPILLLYEVIPHRWHKYRKRDSYQLPEGD